MNNIDDFIKEIQEYSLEELELIYETQKDLYSEEEMQLIEQRIEDFARQEKERIEKLLPTEIICEKCDGPNPFENDTCAFCDARINKEKYYNPKYYEISEEESNEKSDSNTFRYVISFLIPLVGYILGAILISKDNKAEKSVGKSCIILSIVSTVLCTIIWMIYISSMLYNVYI